MLPLSEIYIYIYFFFFEKSPVCFRATGLLIFGRSTYFRAFEQFVDFLYMYAISMLFTFPHIHLLAYVWLQFALVCPFVVWFLHLWI